MDDPKEEIRRLLRQIESRTGFKPSRIAIECGLAPSTFTRQTSGTAKSVTSTSTIAKIKKRFPEETKQTADDPTYLAEVADRIRKARAVSLPRATDKALAAAFSVTQEELRLVLAGTVAPGLSLLRVIAARLRVTTDFLISGQMDSRLAPEVIHDLLVAYPELRRGTRDTPSSTGTDPA